MEEIEPKTNEELELRRIRKELQEKINKINFCWVCGREVPLTKHHAIPQRVENIVMNISIPVCSNCKELIHKYDELIGIIKKVFLR